MSAFAVDFIPEEEDNYISKSKNYRIFSQLNPVYTPISILAYSEDIEIGLLNSNFIFRSFRYSTNRLDWSLWYTFSLTDLTNINSIVFDKTLPLFVDVKIQYNNGTSNVLVNDLVINSIRFNINTRTAQPEKNYQFHIKSTTENGPALDLDTISSFRPYVVNSANQLHIGMSYQTNIIFGHEVVYFKTVPDLSSGDFVFKEWTIQNMGDRKCIKIMVPDNIFPDNKPKFAEFGMEYEVPFEVHIDNSYFQLMFGKNSQPRVRDFMYIPIMERMYEVQSCYLFKGFMLEGIYWKLSLTKYKPSSDMIISPQHEDLISELITSADQLFKPMVDADIADATLPGQFDTTTSRRDSVRLSIAKNAKIKKLDKNFMYMPLISNYYDMSLIQSATSEYNIEQLTATNKTEVLNSPSIIRAYEDSAMFIAWRSNLLNSLDTNILGLNERYLKITGPLESHNDSKTYIEIESHSTNLLDKQRNLLIDYTGPTPTATFKSNVAGLNYKVKASLLDNLTISFSFMIKSDSTNCIFIDSNNNENAKNISVQWNKSGSIESILVKINNAIQSFTLPSVIAPNVWHSLIIPISSKFKQVGMYLYKFNDDLANNNNWNSLSLIHSEKKENINLINFSTNSYWTLPAGRHFISNIRVIDGMIGEEKYEYLINQQILTNLGLRLQVIDNCKERLDLPYISMNR